MRYANHEIYLREKAITDDLKADLRSKIVGIFAEHGITEKGESHCEIFPTLEELQASYSCILQLHLHWWKSALNNATEMTKIIYQQAKSIAA